MAVYSAGEELAASLYSIGPVRWAMTADGIGEEFRRLADLADDVDHHYPPDDDAPDDDDTDPTPAAVVGG